MIQLPDPPLVPEPDEARSLLRRELLEPKYHEQNILQRVLRWLEQRLDAGLETASGSSSLTTLAALVVFALLLAALTFLLTRARRTARTRGEDGAVLTDEVVTAREMRRRADAAFAEGRHEDAVVDGYRALALHQVERGRLEDAPGATAFEVATVLAKEYPDRRPQVRAAAALFDAVRYGDRPATRDQAAGVLSLDDQLVGAR